MRPIRRITLVSGQLELGGQERSLYLLARALDRTRFDLDVVSLTAGGYWAGQLRELGIPVLELPRRHRWQMSRLLRLIAHLRRRRPSLLYSLGYAANIYGRLAGVLAGAPHLVTGWRALEARPSRRFVELLLSRRTDRIICNSNAVRQDFLAQYPVSPEKVIVIRNGVEAPEVPGPEERARLRRELGVGASHVLVGCVARASEDKNLDLLVNVGSLVRQSRPGARFVVIGGGPQFRQIEERVARLGQTEAIRLVGERPDGRALVACFDIFVLTSYREGMPNAVLEAMAAGVPCVTTAVGGCLEVVADLKTGFLVPSGDAEAMAARILELVDDPHLRRRLGDAGRRRALSEFSLDRMAREHEVLFDELTP